MKRRALACLMALAMALSLLPVSALAAGAETEGLVSISTLQAAANGTYDHESVVDTNGGHVQYTYYNDPDKMCSYSAKDEDDKYLEGQIPWVKTVTITGIAFNQLNDGSEDMTALQRVIMNGRRQDTAEHFKDSIEVKFVNCAFHQTSAHLQVYKIKPCDVTKYTFENCTFTQEAAGQYAVTLNATETAYDSRAISYEIINSVIDSKGRGINITAGTEKESLGSHMPSIVIRGNTFTLPAEGDSNMAIQLAGNWDSANLTAGSDPLITVSENSITAYAALRINDNMSGNTTDSAKYVISFEGNVLSDGTKGAVTKSDDTNETTKAIAESYDAQLTTPVAQVDGTAYTSLSAAVAAAENGQTVKLLKNIALTGPVNIAAEKNVTVDLAGFAVTDAEDETTLTRLFMVNGALTIQDSSADGTGSITGGTTAAILASGAGSSVTVTGGEIHGAGVGIWGQFYADITVQGSATVSAGNEAQAINAIGSDVVISADSDGNAPTITGDSGITLFNVTADGQVNNEEGSTPSTLIMSAGSIEAKTFAISGNNLQSALTTATITGGSVVSTDTTAIYWPMEGTLSISGNAVVTGGTAIEAKMGTINISGGTITGTGTYKEDSPMDGGSSPEGSALLLSAEMYGASGQYNQYINSPNLNVSITGGKLSSNNGNAVTVYNSEVEDAQDNNDIIVSGTAELTAAEGKNVVKVITKNDTPNDVNVAEGNYTTEKNVTSVTVSNTVAAAAVDSNGTTSYYSNVNDAVNALTGAVEPTKITIYGDTTLRTDMALTDNITLVVTPDAAILAAVTASGENKAVVTETDVNGNTIYKVIETPADPAAVYAASITAGENTSYFDTLASALRTVQSGQTIKLLKDNSETVEVSKAVSFTLDISGFSFSGSIKPADGFTLSQNGSTYTISVFTPSTGSGSSVTRYEVAAAEAENGTVTVSPQRAARGRTVTITATPDEGYEVASVTVVDADGSAVAVTDKGDGKFTFTMPRGKVSVAVTFQPAEEEPEPQPEGLPFTDVAEGDWYYDAVSYAWENDLMTGTSATLFAPNVTTTRAMLATLLWRLEGEPDAGSASFTDVAAGTWYSDAVAWAASEGVVNGVGDGSAFDPNGNITREQMAVMLYRYADYKGCDITQGGMAAREYEDYGTVSSWAQAAVDWAVNAGLISGTSATTLTPQGSATRAEIATILMRFVETFVPAE